MPRPRPADGAVLCFAVTDSSMSPRPLCEGGLHKLHERAASTNPVRNLALNVDYDRGASAVNGDRVVRVSQVAIEDGSK